MNKTNINTKFYNYNEQDSSSHNRNLNSTQTTQTLPHHGNHLPAKQFQTMVGSQTLRQQSDIMYD